MSVLARLKLEHPKLMYSNTFTIYIHDQGVNEFAINVNQSIHLWQIYIKIVNFACIKMFDNYMLGFAGTLFT